VFERGWSVKMDTQKKKKKLGTLKKKWGGKIDLAWTGFVGEGKSNRETWWGACERENARGHHAKKGKWVNRKGLRG